MTRGKKGRSFRYNNEDGIFEGFEGEKGISNLFFALEGAQCLIENDDNARVDQIEKSIWRTPFDC